MLSFVVVIFVECPQISLRFEGPVTSFENLFTAKRAPSVQGSSYVPVLKFIIFPPVERHTDEQQYSTAFGRVSQYPCLSADVGPVAQCWLLYCPSRPVPCACNSIVFRCLCHFILKSQKTTVSHVISEARGLYFRRDMEDQNNRCSHVLCLPCAVVST